MIRPQRAIRNGRNPWSSLRQQGRKPDREGITANRREKTGNNYLDNPNNSLNNSKKSRMISLEKAATIEKVSKYNDAKSKDSKLLNFYLIRDYTHTLFF
jgi:hypothetical protein